MAWRECTVERRFVMSVVLFAASDSSSSSPSSSSEGEDDIMVVVLIEVLVLFDVEALDVREGFAGFLPAAVVVVVLFEGLLGVSFDSGRGGLNGRWRFELAPTPAPEIVRSGGICMFL
jgi:hypothetical protein